MTNKEAAIQIIRRLRDHGYEAFLAGGCVRDQLLNRQAKDYDVATSAEPAEVTKLFKRTLEVGAQFGVVIVLFGKEQVEVATFRIDCEYVDGRRPSHIEFTSAREDASRRDFTVNGMFYDPIEAKIIDYVDGQADIKAKIIRTIGPPHDRFNEDYLRMLRAVRFAAQLDFTIEPATFAAIQALAGNITKTSGERICMELTGLLTCPGRAHGARLLWDSGLAQCVLPDISVNDKEMGLKVLAELPEQATFPLGLASLFVQLDVEKVLTIVQGLKLSRKEIAHLQFLLEHRGILLEDTMPRAKLRMLLGEKHINDLFNYQEAIQRANHASLESLKHLKQRIQDLGDIEYKPAPLLKGSVLHRLGVPQGPTFGRCLDAVYMAQLEGEVQNQAQAEACAKAWLKKEGILCHSND